MNNLPTSSRPRKKKTVLEKELEDGMILYNPESEKVFSLNNTAAYIWTLCDGKRTIDEIIDYAKKDFKKFDGNPKELIISTINNLIEEGLIAIENI